MGIIYIVLIFFISIFGHFDTQEKADIAIVLGNKVNKDGALSKRLKARLDKSIELYFNKQVDHLLFSGAIGKEGLSEAHIMKDYAIKNGVLNNHILLDQKGYNTNETAKNSYKILTRKKLKNAIIITQHYHVFRTAIAMQKYGVPIIGSVHPNFYEFRDLYSLTREIFAIIKYLIIYQFNKKSI